MFNLLKIFGFKKFIPQVIEEKFPEPVSAKTYQYLNHLADKLTDLEKRLDYVEEHGKEEPSRSINRKLNKYDEEVKRFSKIEREYISLYIDRLIVKESCNWFDFSIKREDFPWHKKDNGNTLEWNNWLWTFRCYLLTEAVKEMYNLRRKSIKIISSDKEKK